MPIFHKEIIWRHILRLIIIIIFDLSVGIITSWMEEVPEETIDTVKVDVSANNDELSLWVHLEMKKVSMKLDIGWSVLRMVGCLYQSN